MLTLMEGPQAAADRARLATLGPKDKYLALTKAHYDNIRANITYSRLDSRGRGRVQLAAELPPALHRRPLAHTAGGQLPRACRRARESTPTDKAVRARGRAVGTVTGQQRSRAPLSRIIYRHAHNCGARCDPWLEEVEDQGSGPRAQDDICEKKWDKARIGCTMC
jgi:hypothetical protein